MVLHMNSLTNIRLGLRETYALAYFASLLVIGQIKYNTCHMQTYPAWGQCYKTFYGRNLQIFVIS